MSKHKLTNSICIAVIVSMLVCTAVFLYSPNLGVMVAHAQPEYASRLFSTDKVHTIDILADAEKWQEMLDNAQAEAYMQADVIINGEKVSGVGIRTKGNSSLSQVASSDSDRYSFKVEFDHYSGSISYHGLDKLALNNLAQDNTYLKDYITYQMMNEMGADAPLSSFIWVTVNGEDWGLYLAVETVEESFAKRVYGSTFGEIYKPDTMDMNDVANFQPGGNAENGSGGDGGDGRFGTGGMPDLGSVPNFERNPDNSGGRTMPDMSQFMDENGNFDLEKAMEAAQNGEFGDRIQDFAGGMGGGMGGFGTSSGATSLIYTDDDPDSYAAIFDNAVFNASESDKNRLIASLKQLNEGEDIAEIVNVEEVIRYFVVHNFVLNSDSYTGSLVHNYYLAENEGQLSMIAWDYNLAFGGMGGMGGGGLNRNTADSATQYVNYPIDDPLLSGSIADRPMIAWIFENAEYLAQYHQVYAEYVQYFTSGEFADLFDSAVSLISPYVEKDPSSFCTYDEFIAGSTQLRAFCLLRAESIAKQLDGTIASTSAGQSETGNANFVDASHIDIESMGSNSMGFGNARGQFNRFNSGRTNEEEGTGTEMPVADGSDSGGAADSAVPDANDGFTPPEGMEGFPNDSSFTLPEGMEGFPSDGSSTLPEGMEGFPNDGSSTPPGGMGGFPSDGSFTPPEGMEGFPQTNGGSGSDTGNAGSSADTSLDAAAENPAAAEESRTDARWNFADMGIRSTNTADSGTQMTLQSGILLGICGIVLTGGILFARKKRKYGRI